MNTRRAAHAAGPSWRKWQDPIVVARSRVDAGLFWLLCALLGGIAGRLIGRL